ncbi:carboxyltransferase domain-containing protein [Paenarthrobacter ureafaciens]|uniref:5-oxoprolinase subunit B/C family protein n=1 Tax=Paenarthrobacter ureafaciens TaxID=37931 RepID=UPI0029300DEF|nr:carboxyltransferase domain-containing protein [Paenarthrobacter ureafaciens]WNZ06075.1 carboxyltransferase domain-containing protein [Paenarthrobacter ureafaciens]
MDTVMETVTSKKVRAVRPVGTRAVLAELDGLAEVLALQDLLNRKPLPGQVDVLAAAETVMVVGESASATRAIGARLLLLELTAPDVTDSGLVVIETVYDGEDLADVAELTGLSVDGVVAAHTGQTWTVAFAGFAPGFGYMVGENNALTVSRRATPRTAVPAGSVALGGEYSAVYPRRSPGGWQLIGRTGARMWDLERPKPALVRPGDRVQYRAVREVVTASAHEPESDSEHHTESGLRIVSPGVQSLIEDLGRRGHGPLGVSAAGALDRASIRRANRLVGNASTAAAIESVGGGLSIEAIGDQVIAVTGAPTALTVQSPSWADPVNHDGGPPPGATRTVGMAAPFALLDGEVLSLGVPESGFRNYVAIRGGIDVPAVLGSRSADTMSGIGPAPLRVGKELRAGSDTVSTAVGSPELQPDFPGAETVTVLDVVPGPRADWFDQSALESLASQDWVVTPQSNRVGMRLDGQPLVRTRDGELPSEGTMAGALQIPPAGLPVLFLADHPITGGYPVIGVVRDEHLDRAAQVPVGGKIRFRLVPDSPDFQTPEK